jgi:TPR repeat protein
VELDQIDVSRAIPACTEAANANSIPAMSRLARAFEKKGDYAEALRWFEKAASADDTIGMIGLGLLYVRGHGIAQDFAKARELWEKAATKGNSLAMAHLGVLFAAGLGVPQDYAKASDCFKKAAVKIKALEGAGLSAIQPW